MWVETINLHLEVTSFEIHNMFTLQNGKNLEVQYRAWNIFMDIEVNQWMHSNVNVKTLRS